MSPHIAEGNTGQDNIIEAIILNVNLIWTIMWG